MIKKFLVLVTIALVMAACTTTPVDLQVTDMSPAPGAVDVAVDAIITATFNVGLDPDSVDGNFSLVGPGDVEVAGVAAYDAPTRTATFTPDAALEFSTVYTATVSGEVSTESGVTLGGQASWSFTTEDDPSVEPAVESVTIDQGDMALEVGDEAALTATVVAVGGADDSVTWSSDNTDAVTINDESGALEAVGEGVANITATSNFDGEVSDSITVTVTATDPDPAVQSVTIDQNDMGLIVGEDAALTATVVAVGGADDSVTWSSNNEAAVTIDDETGALVAVGVGVATITATSNFDGNVSDSITVTVSAAPAVISVMIDQGDMELFLGDSDTLTVTVVAAGGADESVTWESDNEAAVEVNETTGEIAAVGVGSANITATSVFNAGATDTVTITVPEPDVTSVTIDDGDLALIVGDSLTLTATVVAVGGADDSVTWSSDNTDAVTIDDETGELVAVGEGVANVTATSNFDAGVSDTIEVVVDPAPEVVSVTINEGDQGLAVDDSAGGPTSVALSVTVDVIGSASQDVTWASDDEDVATVVDGLVTAVGVGTANITATSVDDGLVSDSVVVEVVAALSVTGDYTPYEDFADVREEISMAFPATTGGFGSLTYTLEAGALPADFVTVGGGAATYSMGLDGATGEISGSTGFPGVFTGTVRATDEIGQFVEADFELDLEILFYYTTGVAVHTPHPTNTFSYPNFTTTFFIIPGDNVRVSGVNNTDFLPEAFRDDLSFTLTYISSNGTPNTTQQASFVINPTFGLVSRVASVTTVTQWVYRVDLAYDTKTANLFVGFHHNTVGAPTLP